MDPVGWWMQDDLSIRRLVMIEEVYSKSSEDVTVKHGKQFYVTVKHLSVSIGGNSFHPLVNGCKWTHIWIVTNINLLLHLLVSPSKYPSQKQKTQTLQDAAAKAIISRFAAQRTWTRWKWTSWVKAAPELPSPKTNSKRPKRMEWWFPIGIS